jgi:DNA-binding transcriptional regulator GbsR (MarR family)
MPRGTSAKITGHFLDHKDEEVTINELLHLTGVSTGAVSSAITYLTSTKGLPIETLIRGQRWKYSTARAAKSGNKRIFEELAETRNGIILVECEDGRIYKLEEL